jgi:hypothetical protein
VRGGHRGTPAVDRHGSLRCVDCLEVLPDDHGRSPYCKECRAKAKKVAWKRRNDQRQAATKQRATLQESPHFVGQGYVYGRDGVYLEAELLHDLRRSLAGLLGSSASWSQIAYEPFDAERARQYHRGLRDLVDAVKESSEAFQPPLNPKRDSQAKRRAGRGQG